MGICLSVLDDAAAQHLIPVVQHHGLTGGDGPLGPVKDYLYPLPFRG